MNFLKANAHGDLKKLNTFNLDFGSGDLHFGEFIKDIEHLNIKHRILFFTGTAVIYLSEISKCVYIAFNYFLGSAYFISMGVPTKPHHIFLLNFWIN